jgi:hypothetical protein
VNIRGRKRVGVPLEEGGGRRRGLHAERMRLAVTADNGTELLMGARPIACGIQRVGRTCRERAVPVCPATAGFGMSAWRVDRYLRRAVTCRERLWQEALLALCIRSLVERLQVVGVGLGVLV